MSRLSRPTDAPNKLFYSPVGSNDHDNDGDCEKYSMETIALVSDDEGALTSTDNTGRNIQAEGVDVTCWEELFDRTTAPAKLFYFVKSTGGAFLVPYLPVFYRQLGLSPAQNGVLGSLSPFITLLSAPVWGAVADRTRRLKSVLLFSLLAFNLFHFLRWFVPSALPPAVCLPGEFRTCARSEDAPSHPCNREIPASNNSLSDLLVLRSTGNGSIAVRQCGEDAVESGKQARTFAWMVTLVVCTELFAGAMFGLSDTAVIRSLGKRSAHLYSRQRLWGAVGWGIGTFTSGLWANAYRDSCGNGNYAVHFGGFAALFSLATGIVFTMDFGAEEKGSESVGSMAQTFLDVVRQPRAAAFFCSMFSLAVSRGVVTNFVFWFLKERCASEVLLGLALFAMALSEVPVFAKADEIIAKLGFVQTLCIVFFAFTLRLLLYSVLSNPWAILPIELLHGITFALLWSCSVQYCNHIAPPGLKATFQSVLNAVVNGFGRGVGSIAGGLVYQRFGAHFTFSITSVWCLIGGLTFALSHYAIERFKHARRFKANENLFVDFAIDGNSSDEEDLFSQFPSAGRNDILIATT